MGKPEDWSSLNARERDSLELTSLWDMLRFYADRFLNILNLFGAMRTASEIKGAELSKNGPLRHMISEELLHQIDEMGSHLDAMGLSMSRASLDRLRESLLSGRPVNFSSDARKLADLQSRIEDEFKSVVFLSLNYDDKRWFDPPKPLMGRAVEERFPSTLFEIDEAGKCQALGRYTAAVFHLMRVMEISLKATAACLAIPDPVKPADRNWGSILRAVKSEIDRRSSEKPPAWSMSGDRVFFGEVYASLDSVKNSWRNSTMHVEKKYTEEEAEHIFTSVRGLMMKIAARFDEAGLPLA